MTSNRLDHSFHTLDVHSQYSHAKPRSMKLLSVTLVFLVGLLLFSLGACSAGTSPTNVGPQATAPATQLPVTTPTLLPAGIVLYQADWSHGLSGWPETQGWKVVQGLLESDASSSSTFTIPYQPQGSNYAIEIRMEIVRLLSQIGASSFDIFAIKAPGRAGYQAGNGLPNAFYPRSGWQTYRVEVRGNEAIFLVDGTQISSATSQQTSTLSNGPLGLSSQMIVLRVSSVRILAL